MIRIILLATLLSLTTTLSAQNPLKKKMDIGVYDLWNSIESPKISSDGNWICYVVKQGEQDTKLHIYNAKSKKERILQGGSNPHITPDNDFVIFTIKPPLDSIRAAKRKKVKEYLMPKDTLGILNLKSGELTKIPNLKHFKLPKKWNGYLAYQLQPIDETMADSAATVSIDSVTQHICLQWDKTESEKNGSRLIIRELNTTKEDTLFYVTDFQLAEEKERLIFNTTGNDTTILAGVYLHDCAKHQTKALYRTEGTFKQLNLDKKGEQASFVADVDTTDVQIRPYGVYYWKGERDTARLIMQRNYDFLPEKWLISEHYQLNFSDDGSKLFFGINPAPILQDTSLLEEEIVEVEVWTYQDKRLYPQQKNQLEKDKKKAFVGVYNTRNQSLIQLQDQAIAELRFTPDANANHALAYNETNYLERISWDGFPAYKDIYSINILTGNRIPIAKNVKASPNISPNGRYIYWYSYSDSTWVAASVNDDKAIPITVGIDVPLYDELNDRPRDATPYGIAAWLDRDMGLLIYDRYDIWQVNPTGGNPKRLTKGRETKTVYRYIKLDPDAHSINPNETILLHTFNENNAASGYANLSLRSNKVRQLVNSAHAYSKRPIKAQEEDKVIFTKENFQEFPDLWQSNTAFSDMKKISLANPQQRDYAWGTIEHYEWTSLDGQQLKGLLVKPENFDPNKKYPMIVNFYERSSHRLHQHRAPYAHRSTINYTYYANQGYLIFNPDVPYKIGYPGESAYDAVLSGVSSLISEGFVDENNIGLQGHSWGGYQVAHIITKTNLFKCAESGAPVVNMFSAYGGIRWGSGLSRMFQYEQTQSRIGGTIWDKPLRYLENSPIFFADKIETPVLILHNDKDGAVPWYQGIEFFVAMRRLNKAAWLLNYNNEPHWPVKRQNRLDFNHRMQQFFDFYLKDAPEPAWMKRGVPAIEKGILQGLD